MATKAFTTCDRGMNVFLIIFCIMALITKVRNRLNQGKSFYPFNRVGFTVWFMTYFTFFTRRNMFIRVLHHFCMTVEASLRVISPHIRRQENKAEQ